LQNTTPGIYRGKLSFEQGFTRIPNDWLRDDRITFRAKGLLAYLLSHEVGYTITIGQIERETGDGRHAIRGAIDDLVSNGYLETQRTHDERGWNAGLAWFLQDPNPKSENPTLENPTLEKRPALEENLIKKNTLKRSHAQGELEPQFSEFWKAYPRKVGKVAAKKAFVKAWTSLVADGSEPADILTGVALLAIDPNKPSKEFLPHPSTWLNEGRWDDEPYPEREKTKEELDAIRAEQVARRREADRREAAERREQARLDEERLAANPVTRCEHDRVKVICPICSK